MQKHFEKIGIIYNKDIEKTLEVANLIHQKLNSSEIYEINKMPNDINLAIAIGGDGTILKCARFYSKFEIPILGFNVGRLGYLAQANPSEIDNVVKKLQTHDFEIENRLMLKANNQIALNDIVIKGATCTRSATFDLFINDKIVCSYVADGLIISTPTGSTAYSLSAGGPIISPELDCFLIIPICPHTLTTRPIVIPAKEKITIKNEDNEELNVSFDGQTHFSTKNELLIQKNEKLAKLLILNHKKDVFYDILKEKLHWSISPKRI